MSTEAKANSDLAKAGLAGSTNVTDVSLSPTAVFALENAIHTPPTWVAQDAAVRLLPEWLQSWSSLAHILEYSDKDGSIWQQLVAASPETILSVMNILNDLIHASSEKITVESVDEGTWARIVYRVACYQQLSEVLRSKTSIEGMGAFSAAINMHNVLPVYAITYNTVAKHLRRRFPSMFEPVVEDSSNSSASASAPAPASTKPAPVVEGSSNSSAKSAPVAKGSSNSSAKSAPVVAVSSNSSASTETTPASTKPAPVVAVSSNSSASSESPALPKPAFLAGIAGGLAGLKKKSASASDSDSDSDSKSAIVVGRPPNPLLAGIAGGRTELKTASAATPSAKLRAKPPTIIEQLKAASAVGAATRDPSKFANIGSNSSSSTSKIDPKMEARFAEQRAKEEAAAAGRS